MKVRDGFDVPNGTSMQEIKRIATERLEGFQVVSWDTMSLSVVVYGRYQNEVTAWWVHVDAMSSG